MEVDIPASYGKGQMTCITLDEKDWKIGAVIDVSSHHLLLSLLCLVSVLEISGRSTFLFRPSLASVYWPLQEERSLPKTAHLESYLDVMDGEGVAIKKAEVPCSAYSGPPLSYSNTPKNTIQFLFLSYFRMSK